MRRALLPLAALMLALSAAAPAHAAPQTEVIEGRYLSIASRVDAAAMQSMLPGDVVTWDLTVSADAPEPGSVDLSLSGEGGLGLVIDARVCEAAWTASGCPSHETALLSDELAPRAGSARPLLRTRSDKAVHLRLEVRLPGGAAPDAGATADLRVHAEGHGDDLEAPAVTTEASDPAALPRTGMALTGALLLAIGAVVSGVTGAWLAGRRREEATA